MNLTHQPADFEHLLHQTRTPLQQIKQLFMQLLRAGVGIGLGMLALYLMNLIPGPQSGGFSFIPFLIALPVIFVLALYVTLLLHELGHLLAGWLVNFQVLGLIVGPVKVIKGPNGFQFSYSGFKASQFQGRAILVPRDSHNLRRRSLWIYAGGPIVTLLQSLLALFIRYFLSGTTIHFIFEQTLSAFTFTALITLPFTLLPFRFGGVYTDMARILILLFDKARTESMLALNQIVMASVAGTRLRDLKLEPLYHQAKLIKDPLEKFSIQLLYYRHILDQNNPAGAAAALDECLNLLDEMPNNHFAAIVFAEAAYYEARYNHNAVIGGSWLDLAEGIYEKNQWLAIEHILRRAESAILWAENNPEEAYLSAQEALVFLEHSPDQGYVQAERDWSNQLLGEVEPLLKNKELLLPRRKPRELSSWRIAKSMAGAVVIVTLFSIIGLAASLFFINRGVSYQLIGASYYGFGNYAKAVDYFSQSIAVTGPGSNLDLLYSQRGTAYLYLLEFDRAISDFTQAIELRPEGRYYLGRGIAYYGTENYDLAIADLSWSLDLDLGPEDQIKALFFRAAAYHKSDADNLAIEDYEKLLTLKLNLSEQSQALKYLSELKEK